MKIKVSDAMLNVLLAATAIGILFMEYSNKSPKFMLASCAVVMILGLALTWSRKKLTAWIICPVIFFAIGGLRFTAVDTLPGNDISKFEGQEIFLTGVIRDEPQIKVWANGTTQVRFIVDAQSIKLNGSDCEISGALFLNNYVKPNEEVTTGRIGDKIFASGKVKLIHNYNNPGQIDTVTRMKADGITARMSSSQITIEEQDGNFWTKFLRIIAAIRAHYRESMATVMSSEDAAAIFAMLFGGYSGLNPELVEDFQTTGIVHILSVSGSHMSMLAIAVSSVCKTAKIPRLITFFFGIFVIGTYSILSALLPQVVRSGVMGALVFLAKTLNAEAEGARLLTLTAMAMLIYQPLLMFDVSFQLSYTSTAGLMYLSNDLKKLMERLPKFVAEAGSMTIAAQLASLPVVIWYFNQVSLSSVLANVFVMPFLGWVIVGGLLGGIIAAVIPILGKIFFAFEAILFGIGAEINRFFANLPYSSVQVPTLGFSAGFFYYIALITRRPIILSAIVLSIAFGIIRGGGELEVSFIDVGQGDCTVVKTPHGKCMVFDTGGVRDKAFDVGGRVVLPYLKHENIWHVDKMFLTHVHDDHSGGAGTVIKKMPVDEIITAGEPLSQYAAIFGIAEEKLTNVRAGQKGEIFTVDGVDVEILFAPNVGKDNEISNVYRIRYGDVTFLITGDLVKENEAQMLSEGIDVSSTVLKVGHHGSATSSSDEFLRAVNPKCAVICVGYGNNFGHPRAEVLERLENLPTRIFRTDTDGLVKFKTNGKHLSVDTFND
ncbi:MAG: DNA internalization-related competence protein ComEC/Rec2 [Selenomonadaceae bacterium]|nr:DNA internalization-related competence protein ComEC/Rec2 [Selenomonadaceae bacterium]